MLAARASRCSLDADDSRSLPERIAALIPGGDAIGPVRQVTALAGALHSAGFEWFVVVHERRGGSPSRCARYLEQAGVRHCVVEDSGPLDWRSVWRIGRVLRRWRPSIVQTHGYKATALAYLLRQTHVPWPWIGFFHGATTKNLKERVYHWFHPWLLGAADRVVVMSRAQAHALRHCGRRVRIIYNAAVPPAPTGDSAERDRLTALAGSLRRPIVGVVGRLSPEKGVDVFLDACAVLLRKGLAFSALVAGDGPERARLEARCRRLGVETCVRFLGQVYDVDVLYRMLDLVVLPSRSEGLPNTLLEAMRADVPTVATAVGGVPDAVGTSSAARLVLPGSAAALADAIEDALTAGDSPEAAAARREVVSRFSLERRLEAHVQLYRDLLEEARGSKPACVESPAR